MAMDERQTQIREGAGLEESRLNVEFIDWLRKWSTPILIVVALLALGYVVHARVQERRLARVNEAFRSLETVAASPNPSPVSLVGVAEDFAGVRAIPFLARLQAADLYLAAVRRGVDPGQGVAPDGSVASDADRLDESERQEVLAQAHRLYESVLEEAASKPGQELHAIGAAYGLAAVAESRGDEPAAAAAYDRVIELARRAGYDTHVRIAQNRKSNLASRLRPWVLYDRSSLPPLPWATSPVDAASVAPSPEATPPTTPGEPAAPETSPTAPPP